MASNVAVLPPRGSSVRVVDRDGVELEHTAELPDQIFGVQLNIPLVHQVMTAQLAAARQGTQSTKTRGEVSGGGRKPYRQKGTGRARQGSIRAPHFAGGGVAHGPKPRDYRQRTPKKMVRAALRCVLSDRFRGGRVHVVVDAVGGDGVPSTKAAMRMVRACTSRASVLVVAERDDWLTWRSLRNAAAVHLLAPDQLNTYDVLCSDDVIFTESALTAFLDGPVRGRSVKVHNDLTEAPGAPRKPGTATALDTTDAKSFSPGTLRPDNPINPGTTIGAPPSDEDEAAVDHEHAYPDENALELAAVLDKALVVMKAGEIHTGDPSPGGTLTAVAFDVPDSDPMALELREDYVMASWPSDLDASRAFQYLMSTTEGVAPEDVSLYVYTPHGDLEYLDGTPVDFDAVTKSLDDATLIWLERGDETLLWRPPLQEARERKPRFAALETVLRSTRVEVLLAATAAAATVAVLHKVMGDGAWSIRPTDDLGFTAT